MVFKSPSWVPELPTPPDMIPVSEFILNEEHGRKSFSKSRSPYTCGLSGRSYSIVEVKERAENLARELSKELSWEPNVGSEHDKVGAIFSLNTIDLMMVSWAMHRLNGISCPANAAYSASELAFQLKDSCAKCLFTCESLLPVAVEAAELADIPKSHIYLCEVTEDSSFRSKETSEPRSVDDLIANGRSLPNLPVLKWSDGQGKRQAAFICYSSGTSGLPKGVLISHYNVISNILQRITFEVPWRKTHSSSAAETVMGCLPFSHIYGLVLICHTSTYRGDEVIVLPKFNLMDFLRCVERFKIFELFVVPPIVVTITKNIGVLKNFDLNSVRFLFTGAAPLGKESVDTLKGLYPDWEICQAYGLTESATVVCSTSRSDIWPGSSGSLLPGAEVKIISPSGKELITHNTPGELWVKAPSIVIGYLNNEKATKEAFVECPDGRWLKTGDEGEIRVSPISGNEHVWILDRMKELIKVNGNQVAPAELESHLLAHPYVDDCAVISVYDKTAGEAPKAYVVKSKSIDPKSTDDEVKQGIVEFVKKHKARFKWIKEIEFIAAIPKSASGKILRRMLRDLDRDTRLRDVLKPKL